MRLNILVPIFQVLIWSSSTALRQDGSQKLRFLFKGTNPDRGESPPRKQLTEESEEREERAADHVVRISRQTQYPSGRADSDLVPIYSWGGETPDQSSSNTGTEDLQDFAQEILKLLEVDYPYEAGQYRSGDQLPTVKREIPPTHEAGPGFPAITNIHIHLPMMAYPNISSGLRIKGFHLSFDLDHDPSVNTTEPATPIKQVPAVISGGSPTFLLPKLPFNQLVGEQKFTSFHGVEADQVKAGQPSSQGHQSVPTINQRNESALENMVQRTVGHDSTQTTPSPNPKFQPFRGTQTPDKFVKSSTVVVFSTTSPGNASEEVPKETPTALVPTKASSPLTLVTPQGLNLNNQTMESSIYSAMNNHTTSIDLAIHNGTTRPLIELDINSTTLEPPSNMLENTQLERYWVTQFQDDNHFWWGIDKMTLKNGTWKHCPTSIQLGGEPNGLLAILRDEMIECVHLPRNQIVSMACQSYLLSNSTWIPMPTPIWSMDRGSSIVPSGDKLYVMGGRSGGKRVQVYDQKAQKWLEGIDMSQTRAGACSTILDGILIVIGGTGINGTHLKSVEMYDTFDNRGWESLPPMKVSRSQHGCLGNSRGILVVGGQGEMAERSSEFLHISREHLLSQHNTSTWVLQPQLNVPRCCRPQILEVDSQPLVGFGHNGTTSDFEQFANGSWKMISNGTNGIMDHEASLETLIPGTSEASLPCRA